MGPSLHTIVGQGALDEVLSARPEERRQFIEEAAGIAKHRRRRERAERKLAGVEQDVLRLNDVVAELRRQLKPLEKQAELAEKHDELTKEAAALAAGLAAVRLRELYRDRAGRGDSDDGRARDLPGGGRGRVPPARPGTPRRGGRAPPSRRRARRPDRAGRRRPPDAADAAGRAAASGRDAAGRRRAHGG